MTRSLKCMNLLHRHGGMDVVEYTERYNTFCDVMRQEFHLKGLPTDGHFDPTTTRHALAVLTWCMMRGCVYPYAADTSLGGVADALQAPHRRIKFALTSKGEDVLSSWRTILKKLWVLDPVMEMRWVMRHAKSIQST